MKKAAIAIVLATAGSIPAFAAETLSRKAGQWEVKTSIEGRQVPTRVVRQCIDATTDRMLQSSAGPFDPNACEQRNVQRSVEATTTDFACTVAGKPATAHSVVSGDLDSAYTMTVTAESLALPGGRMVMSMDAKWLGLCAADQKPGDIILGNGAKVNILEMQKQAPR